MRHVFFIFLITAVIACGCSGSDKSDDKGGETVLASGNLDASGGTLEADDFAVTVPEGAFSGSAEMSILENEGASSDEGLVTDYYSITGVPESFSKDITVKIKYKSNPSEDPMVGIKMEKTAEDGSATYQFDFVEAVPEDGYLTATIPATLEAEATLKRASGGSSMKISVIGLGNFFLIEDGTRTLSFHSDYLLFGQSLNTALEEIYNDIESYGFDYDLAVPTNEVIRNITAAQDIHGFAAPSGRPIETYLNPFSSTHQLFFDMYEFSPVFDSDDSLATHTAFFRLVQKLYRVTQSASAFFNYAAEAWLRKNFSKATSYEPPGYKKDPLKVLKGIKANPSGSEENEYGDAVLPFMEYLDSKYDMKKNLSVLYGKVFGGKTFIDAISDVAGQDETNWWPDFLKEFLTGTVHDISASTVVADSNISGTFSATNSDTKKTFVEDDTAAFQARIYKIIISDSLEENLDYVRFTITSDDVDDSYLKVIIFGMKNGALNYIGTNTDQGVSEIDGFTDDNTLYAVTVNCAAIMPDLDNVRDIALEVEAVKKDDSTVGDLNKISFSSSVYGTFLYKKTNFADKTQTYDLVPFASPWIIEGSLSGTTFTGSGSLSEGGTSKTINITVSFNDSFDMITSYNFSGTYENPDSNSYKEVMSVSGGNVPYKATSSGWLIFKLDGTDACGGISNYSYHSETSQTVLDTLSETSKDMESFDCSEDSKVEIQVKAES